jgi:recombinational DNA repair ATPase RecF
MAITELRIYGLRTLADVRLSLRDLTVLIGGNGSGKSSIIEACELLRKARAPTSSKSSAAPTGASPDSSATVPTSSSSASASKKPAKSSTTPSR